MNELAATVTIAEAGILAITVDGTESGTLVQATTATDGDEAGTTTWVDGKLATQVSGTTTGETQVDGTVTVFGTETLTETVETDTQVEAGTV
jgi:hypothetical protein